ERHRYQLTGLSGTYGNIKKFLWMVSQDKPMMQATSVRITPKAGIGESRLFTLDVTIVAYADRNTVYEQLNADPGLLLKAAPKAEKKPAAGETKEAAKP
ncbi:MAG TPA: hypothetical protein VEI97_01945, partial [bacterium]|nr:hypothetical protein [bacterium]